MVTGWSRLSQLLTASGCARTRSFRPSRTPCVCHLIGVRDALETPPEVLPTPTGTPATSRPLCYHSGCTVTPPSEKHYPPDFLPCTAPNLTVIQFFFFPEKVFKPGRTTDRTRDGKDRRQGSVGATPLPSNRSERARAAAGRTHASWAGVTIRAADAHAGRRGRGGSASWRIVGCASHRTGRRRALSRPTAVVAHESAGQVWGAGPSKAPDKQDSHHQPSRGLVGHAA